MNNDLSEEASEYGRLVRQALEQSGRDSIIIEAERDPGSRERLVAPVLEELGAWDLQPRADPGDLEAAAALCRSAGYWAVPYPVAERLSRPLDVDAEGLLVVGDVVAAAAITGLSHRWIAVSLTGHRSKVVGYRPATSQRNSPFVADLELEPMDHDGLSDAALGLALPCWTLLGMLDRALTLTREHILVREQFGQRLAAFQGVQFQLADAEVERSGVEALAKYSLWSIQTASPAALDDALALRLAAIDAAQIVFRVAHQLHGALGFCDEVPLSWLSRYSQPLRRLPLSRSATLAEVTRRIDPIGLTGPF